MSFGVLELLIIHEIRGVASILVEGLIYGAGIVFDVQLG